MKRDLDHALDRAADASLLIDRLAEALREALEAIPADGCEPIDARRWLGDAKTQAKKPIDDAIVGLQSRWDDIDPILRWAEARFDPLEPGAESQALRPLFESLDL